MPSESKQEYQFVYDRGPGKGCTSSMTFKAMNDESAMKSAEFFVSDTHTGVPIQRVIVLGVDRDLRRFVGEHSRPKEDSLVGKYFVLYESGKDGIDCSKLTDYAHIEAFLGELQDAANEDQAVVVIAKHLEDGKVQIVRVFRPDGVARIDCQGEYQDINVYEDECCGAYTSDVCGDEDDEDECCEADDSDAVAVAPGVLRLGFTMNLDVDLDTTTSQDIAHRLKAFSDVVASLQ